MNDQKQTRILIVEDNCIAQKMAKIILHSLGCDFDFAENGQTALKLFDENRYDLIFMDLGLPDTDGYSIAKGMRNIEKNLLFDEIPIIGLSVHASEQPRKLAFQSGMNDYVLKPLTLDKCRAILKKYALVHSSVSDNFVLK